MEPHLIVAEGPVGIAPVAIPLSDVLKMDRLAQDLVRARFSGDPEAKEMIEQIFSVALRHGAPGRAHAVVSAFLIRNAVEEMGAARDAQVKLAKAQAAQAQAARAAEPARPATDAAPKTQEARVAGAPSPSHAKTKCAHPTEFGCPNCMETS